MRPEAELLGMLGEMIRAKNPLTKAIEAEKLISALTHEVIEMKRAEKFACDRFQEFLNQMEHKRCTK